jgi:hypothetical protein
MEVKTNESMQWAAHDSNYSKERKEPANKSVPQIGFKALAKTHSTNQKVH